ncbi:MAG: hypothetical protein ACRESR_07670 [Gammaproteobacteria bacterium]
MTSWKDRLIAKFEGRVRQKVSPEECPKGEPAAIPAYHTQYSGQAAGRETIQLVIGLDFGTAYTKVVIGERRRAYAVPFTDIARGGNPYLLPGVLTVAQDGRVRLGADSSGRRVSNLKMRILNGDTGDETLSLAVSFLALVLQHARGWFLNTHRQTYERYCLDWNVNVGLPTTHYQDQSLARFYKQMVTAAWHASTRSTPLDLAIVCDSFADDEDALSAEAVGAFPEFAAQINGYVRSPMRRSDLHLLMDVGAGTVDVAAFNVHQRDGDDVFPIFAGLVKHLGVQMLHKYRVEKLFPARSTDAPEYNEGASDAEVAKSLGVPVDELRVVDRLFRKGLLEQVRAAVQLAKQKYPLSRRWEDGVPFFLCGGGARAELYAGLAERMVRDSAPCPLARVDLPKPERLVAQGIHAGDYDRLSVAYGLSFGQFDIGEIVRTDDIGGTDPEPPHGTACPDCNGTGGYMANSCNRCGGSGWLF